MNIRFYNARILTMANGFDIVEGELWVQGNRIIYVGEQTQKTKEVKWGRKIDCGKNLIMPGFKNAHTHSAMTFLRSFADDLPLLDWLNNQVFPMEAKLKGDFVCCLAKIAIMEYLTSGITSNFDMYFFTENVAKASIESGYRTVFCGHINNFQGDLKLLEEYYLKLNSINDLIGYRLGFHAEYTCSPKLLEGVAGLAHKYKTPVFTHNSESGSEVRQCVKRYRMTPTKFLDSLGMFDYGGGGFHCVHMTDEDLNIFKSKDLFVVTNPASNCKLASGIAPIKKMMDMGINLAIGTDGPASNNCLDMFREMFLTAALQKILEKDASAVDANEVLYMATVGGAKAMGLAECDTLAKGKLADLIMIDLHQPNMQPINNITKNLVYSGSKQNVMLTMVNGKILYENNHFYIGANPEEIYAKANEIINKMKK
jgi:5-methylthioadenosine/S-adenosylhomocysteine deaminase